MKLEEIYNLINHILDVTKLIAIIHFIAIFLYTLVLHFEKLLGNIIFFTKLVVCSDFWGVLLLIINKLNWMFIITIIVPFTSIYSSIVLTMGYIKLIVDLINIE